MNCWATVWIRPCKTEWGEWQENGFRRWRERRCVWCGSLYGTMSGTSAMSDFFSYLDKEMRKTPAERRADEKQRLLHERESLLEEIEPWERRLKEVEEQLARMEAEDTPV